MGLFHLSAMSQLLPGQLPIYHPFQFLLPVLQIVFVSFFVLIISAGASFRVAAICSQLFEGKAIALHSLQFRCLLKI
jgi:hypothetical protein